MESVNAGLMSMMLEKASEYSDQIRNGCAIAVYTVEGDVYTYKFELNDDNERIYSDIGSDLKDPVKYIVCVIGKRGEKKTVDIPPYHLRQKLCEINEKNYGAKLVVQGANGLRLIELKSTLL